jgi:low affinity Fe/Cu permease
MADSLLRTGFRKFANRTSIIMGAPLAFCAAVLLIALWACSYPLFKSFDTWQLVINTATTIITFLMVFLIQNTQNRDNKALQLKLDELIRSKSGARDTLMDLEDCTDEEIDQLQKEFERLRAKRDTPEPVKKAVDKELSKKIPAE